MVYLFCLTALFFAYIKMVTITYVHLCTFLDYGYNKQIKKVQEKKVNKKE